MALTLEDRKRKAQDIYGRIECSTCHNPYTPDQIRWRPFKNGAGGRWVCRACCARDPAKLPSKFSVCR